MCQVWIAAALCLWAVVVAVIDWRQRRIPNWLLLLLLVPAIAMQCGVGTGLLGAGWPSSLLAAAIAFAVTLPGHLVSHLGAGDVKLAVVTGFVLGWPWIAYSLLIAALLLGLNAMFRVALASWPKMRGVRVPTAWALLAGFVAMMLAQVQGAIR